MHQVTSHDQAGERQGGDGGGGLLHARAKTNAEPLHGGERQDRAGGYCLGDVPTAGTRRWRNSTPAIAP